MKTATSFICFMFALIIISQAAASTQLTATFYPSKDTYVDANRPDTNFGSAADLYVEPRSLYERWIYMQFEFPLVPSSSISESKLHLYGQSFTSVHARNIGAYLVADDSWNESSVNWLDKPVWSDLLTTSTVSVQNLWYSWDLTSAVNAHLSLSDSSLSFALKDINTSSVSERKRFWSSDYAGSSLPYMNVTYILPGDYQSTHLVISEVLFNPSALALDTEFIELYNPTLVAVNLSNFSLSVPLQEKMVVLPSSAIIPPHGFYLIADLHYSNDWPTSWPHPDYHSQELNLPNADGGLQLRNAANSVIDTVGWGQPPFGFAEGQPCYNGYAAYSIERRSASSSEGNGFDSGYNVLDFVQRLSPEPQNRLSPQEPALADTTPPAPVTGLHDTSIGTNYIFWQWTNPSDSDFRTAQVFLDSTFRLNTTLQQYNATGLLANTTHTIRVKTVDTSGNINNALVEDPATTLPVITPPDTTPPAPVTGLHDIDRGYNYIVWQWTNPSDPDYSHAELYIDGSFVKNTSANLYNATSLISGHTYDLLVKTADTHGNVNQLSVHDTAATLVPGADHNPPASITNLHSVKKGTNYITWTWTNPSDHDFDHVKIFLNNVFVADSPNALYNATSLAPGTSYTLGISTVDNTSNVNPEKVTDTVATDEIFIPKADIEVFREQSTGVGSGKLMTVRFLVWNNDSLSLGPFSVIENLPQGWTIVDKPSGSVLSDNRLTIPFPGIAPDELSIVEYRISSPAGNWSATFSGLLNYSINGTSATQAIPSETVEVNDHKAFFETALDSYLGDGVVTRTIALNHSYTAQFVIKNIGSSAVTDYETFLYWPFDDSKWNIESISPDCYGSIVDYNGRKAVKCVWKPFSEEETKSFTVQLKALVRNEQLTRLNATYDPPVEAVQNAWEKLKIAMVNIFGSIRYFISTLMHTPETTGAVVLDTNIPQENVTLPINEPLPAIDTNEPQNQPEPVISSNDNAANNNGTANNTNTTHRIVTLGGGTTRSSSSGGGGSSNNGGGAAQAQKVWITTTQDLFLRSRDIQAPADSTILLLSAITSAPTASSAQLSWNTNLVSDSKVFYGYNPSLGRVHSASGLTQQHELNIEGLLPLATYYYKVQSCAAGSCLNSSLHSFSTLESPVYNVTENLEPNYVRGRILLDDSPAGNDTQYIITVISGPYKGLQVSGIADTGIPSFLKGMGYFDTRYHREFLTGDNFTLGVSKCFGQALGTFTSGGNGDFASNDSLVVLDCTVDDSGPIISDVVRSPQHPTEDDTLVISADISDPSGVASSEVHFRLNQGMWLNAPFNGSLSDLGKFNATQLLEYYVTASDTLNNNAQSPLSSVLIKYADRDNDSYDRIVDCNDANPNINPGTQEIPYNGLDDDCNASSPDDDLDSDSYLLLADCNDTNPSIHPNATDIPYDSIDQNCDGHDLIDVDADGYNYTVDCNDTNPDINPGKLEILYNSIDDDCNAATLDDDLDSDGFNISLDCNDNNALVNPNMTEIPYNGLDDDCNILTRDDDLDADGYLHFIDCNDTDPGIHPNATELIDNIDQNCRDDPPVISVPVQTLNEDSEKLVNLSDFSYDYDGHSLAYTVLSGANIACSMDNDLLNITPTQNYFGPANCTLTVSDSFFNISQILAIHIVKINHAPVLTQEIPPQQINEDTQLVLHLNNYFHDIDEANLSYQGIVTAHLGLQIVGNTAIIVPETNWFGSGTLQFNSTDSEGLRVSSNITNITVLPVNDAPVISIPPQHVSTNSTIDLNDYSMDIDNDSLTFEVLQEYAQNVGCELASNLLSIKPAPGFFGSSNCTVMVSDSFLNYSSIFTIYVPYVNQPPVLTPIPDQSWSEDSTHFLNLSVYFHDVEQLNFAVLVPPTNVQVFINNTIVRFVPQHNFFGPDSVVFRASDDSNFTDSNPVSLQITPVNDAPVIMIPNQSMEEDSLLSLDLLQYSADVENDSLTFSIVAGDEICSVNGTKLIIAPPHNFNGILHCSVIALDLFDSSLFSQFAINVTPVNDAPELRLLIPPATWPEDTVYHLDLKDYFVDPENDTLYYSSISNENISVTFEGSIASLAPKADWFGTAFIRFTANDSLLSTQSNLVLLTVTPVNDAPEIHVPDQIVPEDNVLHLNLSDYASDVDEDMLSFDTISELPGVSCVVSGEMLTITPHHNFNGITGCSIAAFDGSLSVNSSFTINVTPTNDAPILVMDIPSQSVDEDAMLTLNLTPYFRDSDNDTLAYNASSNSNFTFVLGNGLVTIMPNKDWFGTAFVRFSVSDGEFSVISNMVLLTVNPVNDRPVLHIPAQAMEEDSVLSIDLLPFATDADNDMLLFSVINNSGVDCSVSSDHLQITPPLNYNGLASCTIVAFDGFLYSAEDIVYVTVTPVNDAPVLIQPIPLQSWPEDSAHKINLSIYFADSENDLMTFAAISNSNVTITFQGGVATLSPQPNWYGTTSTKFTATDIHLSTESNTVILEVTPVNDAPTIDIPDQVMNEDTALYLNLSDYSYDIDHDDLSYSVVQNGSSLVCSIDNDILLVTPAHDFVGTSGCVVQVFDGFMYANTSFDIVVNPMNDAPSLVMDIPLQSWSEDSIHTINLSLYFKDIDGDALSFIASANENITSSVTSSIVSLLPKSDWYGTTSIVFAASDGALSTPSNRVILSVQPVNDAPHITSTPISFATESSVYHYQVEASDVDYDTLTFSLPVHPAGMTIESLTGLISWIPDDTQEGNNNVTVQVSDGFLSDSQRFTIFVNATNDAPLSTPIPTQLFDEDTTHVLDLSHYFTDPHGESLTYAVTSSTHVDSSVQGATVSFVPEQDWSGTEFVLARATDPEGLFVQENISLVVMPINDAPIITSQPNTHASQDSVYQYQVVSFDVEHDEVHYALLVKPSGMSIDANTGLISWTPQQSDVGFVNVTVEVDDGSLSGLQAFVITVTNVNDAPVFKSDIPAKTWPEDSSITLNLANYFEDPDGDTLSYSFVSQHMNATFAGGIATLTPELHWNGNTIITFKATDPDGLFVESNAVQLVITPVNNAPVLEPMQDIHLPEGSLVQLSPHASDPENDSLTFIFQPPFDSNGRWQTTFKDSGVYTTTVRVTDGQLSNQKTVNIFVEESGNHAPTLHLQEPMIAEEGSLVVIIPGATDPDGDSLTYSFSKPFDASGRWQTTYRDEGTYHVNVTVSDGHGGLDSDMLTLFVLNTGNHAPTLQHIDDITVRENDLITIKPVATDPDGDPIAVSISNPVGNDGYWQTKRGDKGTYFVTVTATDGSLSVSQQVRIIVGDAAFQDIRISNIVLQSDIVSPGQAMELFLKFDNSGNIDMKAITVTAIVLQFDSRQRIGPFNLKAGQEISKKLLLDIPVDAKPGTYDLEIIINNGNVRRVKYRQFQID
ncbi:MAG: tandem-95 repeat protein [Candidatus Woesearchaeota archaeon]